MEIEIEKTEVLSKQQKKSKDTRDKIVRATRRILHNQGYEALSVKNICYEAEVSNGSFFHHFKTKEDLLAYYMKEHPGVDPDRLELPVNEGEFKIAVTYVYLSYADYLRELGIEFVSNCYDPNNHSLNMENGNKSSFPEILGFTKRCVNEGIVSLDESIEDFSKDIRMIVVGNIFEWCITDGKADFEGNLRRSIGKYLDSAVIDEAKR